MTTKFDMHIIVPAKMIGTIVELLAGEGILVSVAPVTREHPRTSAMPTEIRRTLIRHHRVAGNRFENGRTITLEALKSGPMKIRDLEAIFESKGRATNSLSPVLSGLTAAGKVEVDRINKTVRLV